MLWCPNCKNKYEQDDVDTCPICKIKLIEMSEEDIKPANKKFVKSTDKYEDLNSSAFTLIITSVVGFTFMILKFLNVIHLSFNGASGILFYIVMGSLFTAFMIIGVLSLIKANKIKKQIGSEEDTTAAIIKYFTDNYSSEQIDSEINASSLSEGEAYYKRSDKIRSVISENFDNIDDSYMDHLIELVYEKIFE